MCPSLENNIDGLIPMPDFRDSVDKYERLQADIDDYEELTSCVKFEIVIYLASAVWYRNLNEEEKVKCAMDFWGEYALKLLDSIVTELRSWTRRDAEEFEGEKILPYYIEFLDAAAMAYCANEDITYQGQDLVHPILLHWYEEYEQNLGDV
ncbi:hypothetical protein MPER_13012 [Moniliophthora perniciosa FA553]|nr:hypothetical protein MPER_13012 [Moniliophthora perniciosa FA553]